jgi:hypothetical protein
MVPSFVGKPSSTTENGLFWTITSHVRISHWRLNERINEIATNPAKCPENPIPGQNAGALSFVVNGV